MNHTEVVVELAGRDFVKRNADGKWQAIGCALWLKTLETYRLQHGVDPTSWPLPIGATHVDILIRELILRCQQKWNPPYVETEICHCRMVPTKSVDEAIISGAHTSEAVSRLTMASTACGTCRPDVEKLLAYRLASQPSDGP